MTHRFLAFLLAGVLALAALDGFELRGEQSSEEAASSTPSLVDDSGEVTAMDSVLPLPKKR